MKMSLLPGWTTAPKLCKYGFMSTLPVRCTLAFLFGQRWETTDFALAATSRYFFMCPTSPSFACTSWKVTVLWSYPCLSQCECDTNSAGKNSRRCLRRGDSRSETVAMMILFSRGTCFFEPLYEQRNSIQDQYDVGSESSWKAIQRMLASVSFFVENISRAGLCSSCL